MFVSGEFIHLHPIPYVFQVCYYSNKGSSYLLGSHLFLWNFPICGPGGGLVWTKASLKPPTSTNQTLKPSAWSKVLRKAKRLTWRRRQQGLNGWPRLTTVAQQSYRIHKIIDRFSKQDSHVIWVMVHKYLWRKTWNQIYIMPFEHDSPVFQHLLGWQVVAFHDVSAWEGYSKIR